MGIRRITSHTPHQTPSPSLLTLPHVIPEGAMVVPLGAKRDGKEGRRVRGWGERVIPEIHSPQSHHHSITKSKSYKP
jgi:hypothetical protein